MTSKYMMDPKTVGVGAGKGGKPVGSVLVSYSDLVDGVERFIQSFDEGGERHGRMPTIPGLAWSLGISSQALTRYELDEDFREVILKVRTFIEMHTAEALFNGSIRPGGPIFALKAGFGWKDGSEAKDINVNFSWNSVQAEAAKNRQLAEGAKNGHTREEEKPIDID